MKQISLLLLPAISLLICISSFSQPTPSWVSRYNGPANRNDNARIIYVDQLGNSYVTGGSVGGKGGDWDIVTIKYNTNGSQQWIHRYNGTGNGDDYPFGMTVDASGNVYITGRTTGSSNFDIVTIKIAPDGTSAWVRTFNGAQNINDFGRDVKVDGDGNVYVAAVTDGANDFNGNKITVIKYDPSGVKQWSVDYNNLPDLYDGAAANKEEVNSMAIDASGNLYLAGYSAGFLTLKYDNSGSLIWQNNLGGADARELRLDYQGNVVVAGWSGRVAKYDPSGNLLWERVQVNNSYNDIETDATGNVYITGNTPGSSSNDIVTCKYAADGSLLWSTTYGGNANQSDAGKALVFDKDGNVYVAGTASVRSGRNNINNYVTIKYNATGVQQWVAQYDGPDKQGSNAFDMGIDGAENIYITGESGTKRNYYDYVTLKYGKSNLKMDRSATVTPAILTLRNYPNPFKGNTIIEYSLPGKGKARLAVYDILGHEVSVLVNEEKAAGNYKLNFNGQLLPAGTYLYQLEFNDMIQTKQMIVAK